MDRITKTILYTGHSAIWITILIVGGTVVAMAATELVAPILVEPTQFDDNYMSILIKTVPALSVLGGVVYLFIRYLENRDKDIRLLLERTITALHDNSKALQDLQMDIRRYK